MKVISEEEYKTLKSGDKVIVYGKNNQEVNAIIEAIGGYCIKAKTESYQWACPIFYKNEIKCKLPS